MGTCTPFRKKGHCLSLPESRRAFACLPFLFILGDWLAEQPGEIAQEFIKPKRFPEVILSKNERIYLDFAQVEVSNRHILTSFRAFMASKKPDATLLLDPACEVFVQIQDPGWLKLNA